MKRLAYGLALLSSSLLANDTIYLESTFVGDKEQPSISHIIPWQPPEGPEKLYRPISGLGTELYSPVDRDVQLRSMEYYEQLDIDKSQSDAGNMALK